MTTHTTHLLLNITVTDYMGKVVEPRGVKRQTACGQFVHITYCSKHRVAVTCKRCLKTKDRVIRKGSVSAIDTNAVRKLFSN